METMIGKCGCNNTYQDNKYGKGMRVHNMCGGKNTSGERRCTNCSSKSSGGAAIAQKTEKKK